MPMTHSELSYLRIKRTGVFIHRNLRVPGRILFLRCAISLSLLVFYAWRAWSSVVLEERLPRYRDMHTGSLEFLQHMKALMEESTNTLLHPSIISLTISAPSGWPQGSLCIHSFNWAWLGSPHCRELRDHWAILPLRVHLSKKLEWQQENEWFKGKAPQERGSKCRDP